MREARNSAQERRFKQSSLRMTFYKSRPRKWNTKISEGGLSSHAHTLADCKIFDRLDKSKEADVYFLENVGFLIVNKYKPHKYSDIYIVVYKKAATEVTASSISYIIL